MCYLNFMLLCSFIQELSTKQENNKRGLSFNFEHKCSKTTRKQPNLNLMEVPKLYKQLQSNMTFI